MHKKIKFFLTLVAVVTLVSMHTSYLPLLAYSKDDDAAIRKNFPNYEPSDCSLPEGSTGQGQGEGEGTGTGTGDNSGTGTGTDNSANSPTGLKTPNLSDKAMTDAINKYIKEKFPNSPLNGLGAKIVASAKAAGINPFVIVAIAQNESSMGTSGNLSSSANNLFGRTASARQPHVTVNGQMWYKWDSVSASIDGSDPSNKNDPAGTGDIASYISKVYSQQISSNDVAGLFNEYAPPSENDTAGYIKNVQGILNTLASYAGTAAPGGADTGTGTGTGTDDGSGTGDQATGDDPAANGGDPEICKTPDDMNGNGIPDAQEGGDDTSDDGGTPGTPVPGDMDTKTCKGGSSASATAVCFAWPDHHNPPYLVMKPPYKVAIDAAIARGEYVGGGIHPGIDCGGFVTRVMRDSGADVKYNYGPKGGNTITQKQYMDANPGKYQNLGAHSSSSGLQPGDIAINAVHTYMFVGSGNTDPISGKPFNSNRASASWSSSGQSWRTPMAGVDSFGGFTWYRLKG